MAEKIRLDLLMAERKLCESREKAKTLIKSGNVFIAGKRCDKAGMMVSANCTLEVRASLKYVSRGGLKLEKAIEMYDIDLTGKVCMDIGASTGGFTDCMLQNGATKVFAVDVGYGQLAPSLRADQRVINMEHTNIRYVELKDIGDCMLDFATIDVSFISLKLVLPVLYKLLNNKGKALCLVKPQFEAGREKIGKKGVVREPSTHIEVCESIFNFLKSIGFILLGATFSPIKGPEGNIEYLYFIEKLSNQDIAAGQGDKIGIDYIKAMVSKSHNELDS